MKVSRLGLETASFRAGRDDKDNLVPNLILQMEKRSFQEVPCCQPYKQGVALV